MSDEDVEAVLDCLRSGRLSEGPRMLDFESAFAAYIGSRHGIAVASGTAALHLAVRALDLGPGDEVIVPGFTFVASANAVRYVGADPVLCEVNAPHDLNIDVDDVRRRITPRTRAVIAVHFCGYSADVLALRSLCDEHGLALIEDGAQSVGARIAQHGPQTGTVGELGCFSLFSKKQLCVGEGGLVVTDDDRLADRVRLLRSHAVTRVEDHGLVESIDIVDTGYSYRLDEPRAALARSRLRRLDADLAGRLRVVRAYRDALRGREGLDLAWDDEAVECSSHFAFPVLLADREVRDLFRTELHRRGIQTTWYPALQHLSYYRSSDPELSLPRAAEAADRHCMLPMSADLTDEQIATVAESAVAAAQVRARS
jgi:dTDP-4-amino-4,6-dideoxygalactose transaminase